MATMATLENFRYLAFLTALKVRINGPKRITLCSASYKTLLFFLPFARADYLSCPASLVGVETT